jgi:putative copper export protein
VTPNAKPISVPYRRVLYAERAPIFETPAGNAAMLAFAAALALAYLSVKNRVELDPRLEFAGSLALLLVCVVWVGWHVRLHVVVDDAQLLLDFAGLRRRAVPVGGIVAVRVVDGVSPDERRDAEWRRRNGWSRWYSGTVGLVVELRDGEKLLVASGQPAKLRDAILLAAELHRAGVATMEETAPTRPPPPP